jgi:hypothetical protein
MLDPNNTGTDMMHGEVLKNYLLTNISLLCNGTFSLLLYEQHANWIFMQRSRQRFHFVWESNYVLCLGTCCSNLYHYMGMEVLDIYQ